MAIYWLTNTAASAARFYYENKHADQPTEPTTVPMGLASFAFDFRPIRRFAERDHTNIVSWSEFDRGSHWAATTPPTCSSVTSASSSAASGDASLVSASRVTGG